MRLRNAAIAGLIALASAAVGCKPHNLFFESVNPASGRLSGGQEVRIRGGNFQQLGSLEVRIGGKPATNVGIVGDDTIVLTTPEGREIEAAHPVDINLLTSDGKSIVLRGAFSYTAGPAAPGAGGPNDDLRRRL